VSFAHAAATNAFAPALAVMRAEAAAPQGAPEHPQPGQDAHQQQEQQQQGGGGGGGGGGDIDEIYEKVIEKLRRELLADRERMGDLLGDLP
jgi:hypothetical protein